MPSKPVSAADRAYDRVRGIGLGFPAADEKLSHGAPSFHVRGKMFLTFVDDHHQDGRLAVWCKSTLEEQKRRVAENPGRYFVPPYVGVKGWLGVNVDDRNADWVELSILVEEGWRSVAPPRVLRGEVSGTPVAHAPPSPRVATDAKVARAALERVSALCLDLPETEREVEGRHATFRVHQKVFAYFLDNHHGDGIVAVCVRSDKRANEALVARSPARYHRPAYIASRGYLGIRLDTAKVDWKDVGRRIVESYRSAAPKRLAARV